MKLFDINGKEIRTTIQVAKYSTDKASKSKLQQQVKELLLKTWPYEIILEEFTVPGSRMSVDFFLPRVKIVIEVQGRQHTEYVSHFHGEKHLQGYGKQKKRDALKENWAEINGFTFIEIFNEKDLGKIQ